MPLTDDLTAVDRQRLALEAAMFDVRDRLSGPGLAAPRVARYWRSPGRLVCAIRTFDGNIGYGCVEGDRSGSFVPTAEWQRKVERELAAAVGEPEDVEEESGLPAVDA